MERSGEKLKQDGGISSHACISCRGTGTESYHAGAQRRKHIMQGPETTGYPAGLSHACLSCRGYSSTKSYHAGAQR